MGMDCIVQLHDIVAAVALSLRESSPSLACILRQIWRNRDRFTEQLEARLKFQKGVARTQMFVSFVDRCRTSDAQVCGNLAQLRYYSETEMRCPHVVLIVLGIQSYLA